MLRDGPWVWPLAALGVASWGLLVPGEAAWLTPVERIPGVGPEPREYVLATTLVLLTFGVLDIGLRRAWRRLQEG